jgi:hypothetical protein
LANWFATLSALNPRQEVLTIARAEGLPLIGITLAIITQLEPSFFIWKCTLMLAPTLAIASLDVETQCPHVI